MRTRPFLLSEPSLIEDRGILPTVSRVVPLGFGLSSLYGWAKGPKRL